MDTHTVIARAFRGEPLQRAVVGVSGRSIYLASPDLLDCVVSGASMPVGFPVEDVYVFDKYIFSELSEEWMNTGSTNECTWRRLQRFHARKEEGFDLIKEATHNMVA